jgi:F-type H+-transporting ATPase subunit delta
VTSRTAAVRYARALFDVVLGEHGDLTAVERQLAEFVDLLRANPGLEKVMLNPAVPAPRKKAAIAELTQRAGLTPVLAKLLVLLAERDRFVLLPDVLGSYRARLLDHQNVVRAEVTSAVALSPERVSQIQRSFAKATGRTVTLDTRVDPALVGGLVARIGSTVYDASLTTQLQKMKERLEER